MKRRRVGLLLRSSPVVADQPGAPEYDEVQRPFRSAWGAAPSSTAACHRARVGQGRPLAVLAVLAATRRRAAPCRSAALLPSLRSAAVTLRGRWAEGCLRRGLHARDAAGRRQNSAFLRDRSHPCVPISPARRSYSPSSATAAGTRTFLPAAGRAARGPGHAGQGVLSRRRYGAALGPMDDADGATLADVRLDPVRRRRRSPGVDDGGAVLTLEDLDTGEAWSGAPTGGPRRLFPGAMNDASVMAASLASVATLRPLRGSTRPRRRGPRSRTIPATSSTSTRWTATASSSRGFSSSRR